MSKISAMLRALCLLVCFLSVDGRYQPEDWNPTIKTIENGFDNSSTLYDDLPVLYTLEEPNVEELRKLFPTDFESRTMRGASDLILSQVEELLKGPMDTVKEINTVGSRDITKSVHENISFLYVKLLTYFIRGYAYLSRSLLRSYKALGGSPCYQVPDIERFFKIFTLKGGEICPFDDFEMQNVTVKSAPEKWIVELPVVFRKVKVGFTSIHLYYTKYLSTPTWTFDAKDVLVKLSVGLSKSLIPYPVSLDLKINVDGCKISDPNSNWIIRKLLKLTSKICDPILNEIIRVAVFVTRVDLKILAWFAKIAFNGDMWAYTVIEWVIRRLHKLLHLKDNYIA